MFHNYTKVLRAFFDDPLAGYQLRQLSRHTRVPPASLKRYLDELLDEKLITRTTIRDKPVYFGNRDDTRYRLLKRLDLQLRLHDTGLLDELEQDYPEAIVLFGSAARGDDTAESDIDLLIIGEEHEPALGRYEDMLNRKISLLHCNDFGSLSEELKKNITNGIVLRGYLTPS